MEVLKLEEIKNFSDIAYDFLSSRDLLNLDLGRYYFDKGIYANVEEYQSKDRHQFEAHKKYIDIQYIIFGEEKIIVEDLNDLDIKELYDASRDIAFYHDNKKGKEYVLHQNECLILKPENGHMPCVKIQESTKVKKIVFKIPYSTLKDIRCLVMDVDGSLTDGRIYMGSSGEEYKVTSVKDGYAIANFLPRMGITPVIITGRSTKALENRCQNIKVQYLYQGVSNKVEKLYEVLQMLNLTLKDVAYFGDDDNDLECMKLIQDNGGLIACPIDAGNNVIKIADFISTKKGGKGAAREFIEWLEYGK